MNTGLYRIEFARLAASGGGLFSGTMKGAAASCSKSEFFSFGSIGLAFVLVAGLGGWMLLSGTSDPTAENEPLRLATAVAPPPAEVAPQEGLLPNPEALPEEAASVDGLKISSQYWRRGGLGSKALVTFTLHNRNDYAVKDIEISCAFSRRDGSHLTDRTRVIHDTVKMRSRKTFARMLVGFVNVNADRAKCSLVNASHI